MINVNWSKSASKEEIMNSVEVYLGDVVLAIASKDFSRPWGGFFIIEESLICRFIKLYLNP
jgi:mannose-6-phosphate isomerase